MVLRSQARPGGSYDHDVVSNLISGFHRGSGHPVEQYGAVTWRAADAGYPNYISMKAVQAGKRGSFMRQLVLTSARAAVVTSQPAYDDGGPGALTTRRQRFN